MSKIVLLDPGLRDHQGNTPLNLGDLIVSESVRMELDDIFLSAEIIRISSHSLLEKKHISLIRECDHCFVGGTNLLSSDALAFNAMPLSKNKWIFLFPPVRNLILMGTGWGFGYSLPVRFKTKLFYKNVLNRQAIHSCRDQYSTNKLISSTSMKVINTSCPTTWRLSRTDNNCVFRGNDCLLTLTDYCADQTKDTQLINILLNNFQLIHFFPQGSLDLEYISSLEIYKKNRNRFSFLNHNYDTFKSILESGSIKTYIGTRLHAGIKAFDYGMNVIVIGVDNRASEIHRDTNFPAVERAMLHKIQHWLDGEKLFEELEIPVNNIQTWKRQFT